MRFIDEEEPQESPNPVTNYVRGLGLGLKEDLPSMIGRASQWWTGGRVGEDLAEIEKTPAGGAAEQAGRMTAPSILPSYGMYGLGKVLQKIQTTPTRIAGSLLQAGSAYLPSVALFGGSRAQETREAAKEAGVDEGAAPYITGGIEAVLEIAGTKALLGLLPPVARPAVMGGILAATSAVKPAFKAIAGRLLKRTLPTELGTEFTQELTEAQTEKMYGIRPEARPFEEAFSVLAPTAIMTLVTGGAVSAGQKALAPHATERVANPEVAPETRQKWADYISGWVREADQTENKEVTAAWDAYAREKIAAGEPIDPNMNIQDLVPKPELVSEPEVVARLPQVNMEAPVMMSGDKPFVQEVDATDEYQKQIADPNSNIYEDTHEVRQHDGGYAIFWKPEVTEIINNNLSEIEKHRDNPEYYDSLMNGMKQMQSLGSIARIVWDDTTTKAANGRDLEIDPSVPEEREWLIKQYGKTEEEIKEYEDKQIADGQKPVYTIYAEYVHDPAVGERQIVLYNGHDSSDFYEELAHAASQSGRIATPESYIKEAGSANAAEERNAKEIAEAVQAGKLDELIAARKGMPRSATTEPAESIAKAPDVVVKNQTGFAGVEAWRNGIEQAKGDAPNHPLVRLASMLDSMQMEETARIEHEELANDINNGKYEGKQRELAVKIGELIKKHKDKVPTSATGKLMASYMRAGLVKKALPAPNAVQQLTAPPGIIGEGFTAKEKVIKRPTYPRGAEYTAGGIAAPVTVAAGNLVGTKSGKPFANKTTALAHAKHRGHTPDTVEMIPVEGGFKYRLPSR